MISGLRVALSTVLLMVVEVVHNGASDAVAFLEVGVPAVEFGPRGAGHHGPDEHVDLPSLAIYRRALVDFARASGALAPLMEAHRGGEALA